MKRTGIKTANAKSAGKTSVSAAPAALPVVTVKPKRRVNPVIRALSAIASLRLTVILMGLSLFLVFAGTLAQIDAGIWSVVGQYFRSWHVWIPFQLFIKFGQIFFWFPAEWHLPGSFPYPAGFTLGFALLFNLLAAHAVRFKLSWKRAGVITLHVGLIVMLVGEFITAQFAVEGNLPIETKMASNIIESRKYVELAIINTTNPLEDVEVAIPSSMLIQGTVIKHEKLPFDVVVDKYYNNSKLETVNGQLEARAAPVASGASTSAREDMPAAYVTLKSKDGDKKIETFLASLWFTDWTYRRVADEDHLITPENRPEHKFPFKYNDNSYQIVIRWQRTYKPYTIALKEFKHEFYPNTDKPKNFSSEIHLVNQKEDDKRDTIIRMNSPMRYRGETFYQSGWLPGDQGTILQVVRNPGWLMPYLSCTLVSLGMLLHFGMKLITYLRRRAAV